MIWSSVPNCVFGLSVSVCVTPYILGRDHVTHACFLVGRDDREGSNGPPSARRYLDNASATDCIRLQLLTTMKRLVMSHYKCSVSGCQRYAVLKQPYCPYCDQYHCFDHIEDADSHPCYGMEAAPRLPHWGYKEEVCPIKQSWGLSDRV